MTSATRLLARCRAVGVTLDVGPDGRSLHWEANADPPADLLADLAANKAAVLALVRGPDDSSLIGLDEYQSFWGWIEKWNTQVRARAGITTAPAPTVPMEPAPMISVAPGVLLFPKDEKWRQCKPEDIYAWCWEGGPRWFYRAEAPFPPHHLALHPSYPKRCRSCAEKRLSLSWRAAASGKQQLRCECGVCRKFIAFVAQPPDNWQVEYRAGPGPM
jgi:hypothetical protein